jgi:hypothetical protein
MTYSISPPMVDLDKTGGQLSEACEFYVPRYCDPPIVEFRLKMNWPLVFEDSASPAWFPNLVLATTNGRAGQRLWIRTLQLPATTKTWYNISTTYKPVGDVSHPDIYLAG